MKNERFTRGPWKVAFGVKDYLFIKAEDGFNIALVTIAPGADPTPDAHLISMAPEMYACLDLVRDHFERIGTTDMTLLRAIRETLSKARGKL